MKLDVLAKTAGDDAFEMRFPPHGERKRVPSVVAARGAGRALALRRASAR